MVLHTFKLKLSFWRRPMSGCAVVIETHMHDDTVIVGTYKECDVTYLVITLPQQMK